MNELLAWLTRNPDVANAVAAFASAVAALLALIISVVSVYVSHTTLKIQQRHNVLSVRPIPMVAIADYEDRLSVKLRNNGSGPLIARDLHVRGSDGVIKAALIYWMPDLPAGLDWKTFVGPVTKRSVPPSDEFTLLELSGDESDPGFASTRDAVRQALGSLTVVVEYTDVYETILPAHEKSLRWFARHCPSPDALHPGDGS